MDLNNRKERLISILNHEEKPRLPTQPSVINPLSSVNPRTSSSSSIVHVSLVACCLGISKVVTMYLLPLSFPKSSPHVSRFRAVLVAAIERKRGRDSRGRSTVRSSGNPAEEEEVD